MSGLIVLGVVLGLILLVAVLAISIYNNLVGSRNRYKNGFAQIDVQLKRRYDLIPNLVETAKGYLKHESETLEAVIRARNIAATAADAAQAKPGEPGRMQALAGAEGALAATLTRFMALQENYPELKADKHMAQLSEELTSTENRIAFARQAYNDSVTDYNTRRETFPAVMFANMLGFETAALLEATESPEERKAPKVSFG